VLEGILYSCRKHASYMCGTLLRIFAVFCRNYSHTVEVCKKIPTHGTRCKTFCSAGIIPINVGIISTSVGITLTHVGTIPILVGIILTLYVISFLQNSTVWEYFLQNFLMLPYTCRNHASYTSVNFGTRWYVLWRN